MGIGAPSRTVFTPSLDVRNTLGVPCRERVFIATCTDSAECTGERMMTGQEETTPQLLTIEGIALCQSDGTLIARRKTDLVIEKSRTELKAPAGVGWAERARNQKWNLVIN